MKLCDNNWNDPSGGHSVETWESKQPRCLALSIADEQDREKCLTATLTPADCLALGVVLLAHAEANGISIPKL